MKGQFLSFCLLPLSFNAFNFVTRFTIIQNDSIPFFREIEMEKGEGSSQPLFARLPWRQTSAKTPDWHLKLGLIWHISTFWCAEQPYNGVEGFYNRNISLDPSPSSCHNLEILPKVVSDSEVAQQQGGDTEVTSYLDPSSRLSTLQSYYKVRGAVKNA